MRQTLYERITPECKEALEYNSKRWRGATNKIVSVLSSHRFWADFKGGDVNFIIECVDLPFAKITSGTYAFGENINKDECYQIEKKELIILFFVQIFFNI